MREIFEIKDQDIIDGVLDGAEYGVIAICCDDKPYSLPLNFVKIGDSIYFHGAKKGRKIEIIKTNQFASFSVVENFSLIPSFFSSNDGLACPATQFFKSIIIDGRIEFVEEYGEKVLALEKLMKKLQPEGRYKPLDEKAYSSIIDKTTLYKLNIDNLSAKFKFGQHLSDERLEMILKHLRDRGRKLDMATFELMQRFRR